MWWDMTVNEAYMICEQEILVVDSLVQLLIHHILQSSDDHKEIDKW